MREFIRVKVKLEKLEVFSETDSVGIEVKRTKSQYQNINILKQQQNLFPK